jgi:hypothetical protein
MAVQIRIRGLIETKFWSDQTFLKNQIAKKLQQALVIFKERKDLEIKEISAMLHYEFHSPFSRFVKGMTGKLCKDLRR